MGMGRHRIGWVAGVMLLALASPATLAFRCGTHLVVEGDRGAQVVARCGRPTDVKQRTVLRPAVIWRYGRPYHVPGGPIEKVVETWLYNLGPNQFMREVTLEDGVVTAVRTLDYGYR